MTLEGIAGTFGRRDKSLVKKMLDKLKHRGPDSASLYESDDSTLGARMMLARPRKNARAIGEDGSIAVASDSYIFNREFLRRTIAPATDPVLSDARLILAMYKIVGPKLFGYIDGAFSIAIVDNGKIMLARDRYGLKPLYISKEKSSGVFSSEIKSQMLSGDEFEPFPPGSMYVGGQGFSRIQRRTAQWARAEASGKPDHDLRELLVGSVQSCVDGPDGFNILLSGGIDSTVVAAAASRVTNNLRSVCVGMEQSADLQMARKVSEILGTKHVERTYNTDDMLKILRDVVCAAESFDYPLVRSCIPNYMAVRLFGDRQYVTLCGEGGDEVFAGYDFMLDMEDDDRLRKERLALLKDGHMTGFQRVDRMTSSASLDGRMPLMSQEIIDFGLSLGKQDLLGTKPGRNKLVLRKAFARDLPGEVIWRRKQRFSDGAGSINSLVAYAEKNISDAEFEKGKASAPKGRIRTKEEYLYYRMFYECFPSSSAVRSVGFTPRP
jgi:asparagine synthase (glutamine-hydrolysing)